MTSLSDTKTESTIRIISWNVAELSAAKWKWIEENLLKVADILFLQETKCKEDEMKEIIGEYLKEFDLVTNVHSPSGLHGVAMLIRKTIKHKVIPTSIDCKARSDSRLPNAASGRLIAIKFESTVLVGSYVPNLGMYDKNTKKRKHEEYRVDTFDPALYTALEKLRKEEKNVVWIGDLNVAHQDIDTNESEFCKKVQKTCFTDKERSNFDKYFKAGWIDIWREQHKDDKSYTHFGRPGKLPHETGIHMRLDMALITPEIKPYVKSAKIWDRVDKDISDHAPIEICLSA